MRARFLCTPVPTPVFGASVREMHTLVHTLSTASVKMVSNQLNYGDF
jgi:hypothetical protein